MNTSKNAKCARAADSAQRAKLLGFHRGTGVHLIPEHRSESSRNRVHLAADSPANTVSRVGMGNAEARFSFAVCRKRCAASYTLDASTSRLCRRPFESITVTLPTSTQPTVYAQANKRRTYARFGPRPRTAANYSRRTSFGFLSSRRRINRECRR
jgi:hypothetical protein